ncbi:DUF1501 domain-containing protein [soil metagenome]
MTTNNASRREFLRASSLMSMLGSSSAAFGLNMMATGAAAAQSATDYKALVCVFLNGGNDSMNMVLPTDDASWATYTATRNQGVDPIALLAPGTAINTNAGAASPARLGGVLPIVPTTSNGGRTFALHPSMTGIQNLFNAGRLAVLPNVGTLIAPMTKVQWNNNSVPRPPNLFSHNDQQSVWQAGAAEGARVGWGGKMGDLLKSMNGTNTVFTAVSTSGNAVFLSGQSVVQYQVSGGGTPSPTAIGGTTGQLFGSTAMAAGNFKTLITGDTPSLFGKDWTTVVNRSMAARDALANALTTVTAVTAPPQMALPSNNGGMTGNGLANALQSVAKMIAAGPGLGVKRQVFFVQIGGFDLHDNENRGQADLMARIGHAFEYFDTALSNLNGMGDMRSKVTTFTASDFGRTFTTNGDGTDHAWGAHHLVMGGAVKGKDFYGRFPLIGVNTTDDTIGSGTFIPVNSVDSYAATMGKWFGISDANLNLIFPNLKNFTPDLGFMKAA